MRPPQYRRRIPEIDIRKRESAKCVADGNRQQRRPYAVPRDVEEKKSEVVFVQPVISQEIASEIRGRNENPVGRDLSLERFRNQRAHVVGRLAELRFQVSLAFFQRLQILLFLVPELLFFQARTDSCPQQHRIERLGEIILRSHLYTPDDAFELRQSGYHNDGNVTPSLVGLHTLEDLVAVHLRHHDVEENEIYVVFAEQFQGLSAILCRDRDVAATLQEPHQQITVSLVVVHNQNLRAGSLFDIINGRCTRYRHDFSHQVSFQAGYSGGLLPLPAD